jgi:hypothetical protein
MRASRGHIVENVQYLAALSLSIRVMVGEGRPVGLECGIEAQAVGELPEIVAGLSVQLAKLGFAFEAPAQRGAWLVARGYMPCDDPDVLALAAEIVNRAQQRRAPRQD